MSSWRKFRLDKGLAAGVAAGGLTQSAIIGTASDAIAKLGLAADEVTRLQGNVAVGYAVTYVFGSFGAIIVCVNILPRLMGRSIKEDAVKAEAAMQQGVQVLAPGQQLAAPDLTGRIYQITQANNKTVLALEQANSKVTITIERVQRNKQFIEVTPELVLESNDIVLVVGRREAMVDVATELGKELYAVEGMELTMQRKEIALTNKAFHNKSVGEIRAQTAGDVSHGIYVVQISRMGKILPMLADTIVQLGDVITIYGSEQDVKRVAGIAGYVIVPSEKLTLCTWVRVWSLVWRLAY